MSDSDRRILRGNQVDMYGLKFIRMIIASYCISVSVGLIHGFDPGVFFKPFFDAHLAALLGATIVLYCAALLFLGFFLRLTSLYLAVVVLFSSMSTNIFGQSDGSLDAFWRDLVIAAALLLNYWSLNERTRNKQSFWQASRKARSHDPNIKVVPARVRPKTTGFTFISRWMKPAVSSTLASRTDASEQEIPSRAEARRLALKPPVSLDDDNDEEIVNLFA